MPKPTKLITVAGAFNHPEAMTLASQFVETRGKLRLGGGDAAAHARKISRALDMALKDSRVRRRVLPFLAAHARRGNLLATAYYLSHNMTVDAATGEYVMKIGGSREAVKMHIKLLDSVRWENKLPVDTRKKITQVFMAPAQLGNAYARNMIMELNMPLVVKAAGKFRIGGRQGFDDRLMRGTFGLARAITSYDPKIGEFSTYATWWINQTMFRSSGDEQRNVRIPVHMRDLSVKIWKYVEALPYGREPDTGKIAKQLGVTEAKVRFVMGIGPEVSMDEPLGESGELSLAGLFGVQDRSYSRVEDRILVEQLLGVLTPREKELIEKRFVKRMTLAEVAGEMDVVRERVRQLQDKALEKMRREAQRGININIKRQEGAT